MKRSNKTFASAAASLKSILRVYVALSDAGPVLEMAATAEAERDAMLTERAQVKAELEVIEATLTKGIIKAQKGLEDAKANEMDYQAGIVLARKRLDVDLERRQAEYDIKCEAVNSLGAILSETHVGIMKARAQDIYDIDEDLAYKMDAYKDFLASINGS